MDANSLILLVVFFGLMYFMMIRPENKRKKQAEEMRNGLKKGDSVTTIGGIVGKVVFTTDENVTIETSEDRVRIELTKTAIAASSGYAVKSKKAKSEPKTDPQETKIEE